MPDPVKNQPSRLKKTLRRVGLGLLVLVVVGLTWQWELVSYGLGQARGQARILWNSRPLADVLADPAFPDSLKQRLRLIQEIRRFAVDSLGINDSQNYTTVYDQRGKPILWTVTAAEPYRLVAKEWHFPVLGTFSYKGFFDYTRCLQAERDLRAQGYDTDVNEVAAWSTLGWFRDPILTSMLTRGDGSLANLIIHELTHGTLFVKDNLTYNENLADFVGDYGATRFLAHKYGVASLPYRRYQDRKIYLDKYYDHLLRGAQKLDSLYTSFAPTASTADKDRRKRTMMARITQTLDTLTSPLPHPKPVWTDTLLPNNAFFVGYKTYRSRQNQFADEFKNDFGGNFRKYLAHLRKTYPSL